MNTTTPATNTRRRPNRSALAPPISTSAPSTTRYAFITHCVPAAPAARSRWIAGNATFTTDPSMNARLEPSTVAASVRVRAAAAQGTGAAGAFWRTPRSHGPRETTITGSALAGRAGRAKPGPYPGGTRAARGTASRAAYAGGWRALRDGLAGVGG